MAMNRLTRELDDYGWYTAALDMLWPKANQAQRRIEVMRRFVERIRCFELGVVRASGVGAVVEEITRIVHSHERLV